MLSKLKNRSGQPSSKDNRQTIVAPIEGKKGEGTESPKPKRTQESNQSRSSKQMETKPIEIKAQGSGIHSVAFLADGKHIVGGSYDRKIRCWLVKDGSEVGTLMDANASVSSLAVSQNGNWIVAATRHKMIVWNAKSRKKMNEFKHDGETTLDVSPDGTKIAGISPLGTAAVWSLSTGRELFKLEGVSMVKFSSDSRLLATGYRTNGSIYEAENGHLLVNIQFIVSSLAWTSDTKQLFVLSNYDGKIRCLDVSSGKTLSEWTIPITYSIMTQTSLSLSSNDTFISSCVNESLSFWDTATHKRIGSVIRLPYSAKSMAMSAKYDLVIGGGGIILYNLREILPSRYIDVQKRLETPSNIRHKESIQSLRTQDKRSNGGFADLNNAIQKPHGAAEQKDGGRNLRRRDDNLNDTINSLRADLPADETTPDERMADLEKKAMQQPRTQLADSQRTRKDEGDGLEKTIKSSDEKIADLKKTAQQLRTQLTDSKHTAKENEDKSNKKIKDLEATIEELHTRLADSQQNAKDSLQKLRTEVVDSQQRACETLFAGGHVIAAAKVLLEIRRSNTMIMDWLPAFTNKCIIELERTGDGASGNDEVLAAYATALSLLPSNPNALLTKWAGIMLLRGSTTEAMDSAKEFKLPSVVIYRTMCDALEKHGRVMEAIECFQQMQSDLTLDTSVHSERTEWELDFRRRCAQGLEKLADAELSSQNYNEADQLLSTILSLDSLDRVDILIKRSKARVMMKSWEDALGDADEVIKLDSSSPLGYEQRRAVLHGMKRYAEAVVAFDTALSKLKESPDERVRKLCVQYTDARPKIRETINETISKMPLELIDTKNGCLLDRTKQAEAFEADSNSTFNELVSSMTTVIDDERIKRELEKFYQYVMLSHRWQLIELRYKDIKKTKVSELKTSSANKLKAFCKLVCSLGFQWAWCDTCCVDQDNIAVLQESLVAMFTWYRGSILTIVYLHDVPSKSFSESEWNKRAWTYQEYVAAETVRFYTKDWKPYLGLEGQNHKQLPVIIFEMERMSQVTADQMAVLRPGRDRVREKLFLASKRRSTRVEDTAYSLLGIFGVSIPVIYGEGTRAVGRFLEHILKGSGDITILAWTGTANEYSSCLPLNLTVYDSLEPPQIPRMETARLDREASKLSPSIPDLAALFKELRSFSSPSNSASLDSGRLRLHCISFHISKLVLTDAKTNHRIYRATTAVFGNVEIKTTSELTVEKEHFVVHPWIPSLLGQEYSRGSAGLDETKKALRLIVRLRQPFGALLLEEVSLTDYKRVATDSLIKVRIPEEVPLLDLVNNIKTIFVQ